MQMVLGECRKAHQVTAHLKPNDIEPFSTVEVKAIIKACDGIGRGPYERLRARAMILTLRYTALRIGDVALLGRERVTRDDGSWRIFLRTEKAASPCSSRSLLS